MKNLRVKYYGPQDLLYGYKLNRIEQIDISDDSLVDINDAIEYFEIKRYFDNGACSKEWSVEEHQAYYEKADKLFKKTLKIFSCLNDKEIVEIYNKVDINYKSSFWMLFDICKLYNKITSVAFKKLIHCEHIPVAEVFSHKNIVNTYGLLLKEMIFTNEYGVNIIIDFFEQDYQTENKPKLYLPKEMSGEDICDFLDKYCDSNTPNVSILESICELEANKNLPISDELKLKAMRRYKDEWKKSYNNGIHFETAIEISIDEKQEKEVIEKVEGNNYSFSYSEKFLLDNLEMPDILNIFIYIFNYVDIIQQRCTFVSKLSYSGIIERTFRKHSKRHYYTSYVFDILNNITTLQMQSYYEFLERNTIQLEDVLSWFFTRYLQEEFGCSEMRLLFPTKNASYAEKCASIITTFDAAIKQYTKFVQNGNIDFELIKMSTKPITFENIPSLNDGKYVYGKGESFEHLCFLMFSDQSLIHYVERIHREGKNYDSFYNLIVSETLYTSDFYEYQMPMIELLQKYDLICIDEADGQITAKNEQRIAILNDLYKNEVISKLHYSKCLYEEFNDLVDLELVEEKSSLFSQPEIDYYNFMLNRSEYCNGLEIRNNYIHGNQHVNPNEEEHKRNYYILLKLFVLFAIKVNDDFCLKYPEQNDRTEAEKN